MRFKKGELTKENYRIIMHDLSSIRIHKSKDNEYFFNLLKGNLQDIFGKRIVKAVERDIGNY